MRGDPSRARMSGSGKVGSLMVLCPGRTIFDPPARNCPRVTGGFFLRLAELRRRSPHRVDLARSHPSRHSRHAALRAAMARSCRNGTDQGGMCLARRRRSQPIEGPRVRILVVHNRYQVRGGEDVAVDDEIEVLRRAGIDVIERIVANHGLEGWPAKLRAALGTAHSTPGVRLVREAI